MPWTPGYFQNRKVCLSKLDANATSERGNSRAKGVTEDQPQADLMVEDAHSNPRGPDSLFHHKLAIRDLRFIQPTSSLGQSKIFGSPFTGCNASASWCIPLNLHPPYHVARGRETGRSRPSPEGGRRAEQRHLQGGLPLRLHQVQRHLDTPAVPDRGDELQLLSMSTIRLPSRL